MSRFALPPEARAQACPDSALESPFLGPGSRVDAVGELPHRFPRGSLGGKVAKACRKYR
jgi:hypothetical protein